MPALGDEHLSNAYSIWLTAGWNGIYRLSETDFKKSWKASFLKVGYWVNDEVVAISRANTDGIMYSMIYDVVVQPEFRGRGYGKFVVNEIVDRLKDLNIRSIQLMAASGQCDFYRKLGFKERMSDRPGMEFDWASPQNSLH